MFYVYILYSDCHDRTYVGMTERIDERLKEHNAGKMKSTKAFVPWKFIHREEFSNKAEARQREKYLKTSAGRRWRKNNLMAP